MPLVKNGRVATDSFVHVPDGAELPGDGAVRPVLCASSRLSAQARSGRDDERGRAPAARYPAPFAPRPRALAALRATFSSTSRRTRASGSGLSGVKRIVPLLTS